MPINFFIMHSFHCGAVLALVLGVFPCESRGESVFLQAVGGKRLTIEYDRAAKVPSGKVSILGRLTSEYDFAIGDVLIPAETYSLFVLATETGWKLIINKVYKPEGFEYDPREDVGRFDMELSKTSDPAGQLLVAIVASGGGKGKIKIDWEKSSAILPFAAVSY